MNDNSYTLGFFLFFLVIFLFVCILSWYREKRKKPRAGRICIYCGKPHTGWGAEHFWCGIRHPHLSIPGTVSHVLSVISRPIPPISDFFIRKRDFAEDKVKELGKKRKKRRKK